MLGLDDKESWKETGPECQRKVQGPTSFHMDGPTSVNYGWSYFG